MKTLYIVRHGQTLWNIENRKQGHQDSPLTLKGIQQAHHIAVLLKKEISDFSHFYFVSSPLYRAHQFALILAELLDIGGNFKLDILLKEHGFGSWEGMTQKEINTQYPDAVNERKNNHWNYVIPGGGESYEIISHRTSQFLNNHAMHDNLIIVCHEMISNVVRGHLLQLSQESIFNLKHPQDTIYCWYDGKLKEIQ